MFTNPESLMYLRSGLCCIKELNTKLINANSSQTNQCLILMAVKYVYENQNNFIYEMVLFKFYSMNTIP